MNRTHGPAKGAQHSSVCRARLDADLEADPLKGPKLEEDRKRATERDRRLAEVKRVKGAEAPGPVKRTCTESAAESAEPAEHRPTDVQDRFRQNTDIVPIQGQPAGSSGDPVDPPNEPGAKRPKYVPGFRGCLKREHPIVGAEQQATRPPPGLVIKVLSPQDTTTEVDATPR